MASNDRFPLIGYAYELVPGDEVDGVAVTSVDDPDRPSDLPPLMPAMGPGSLTVKFKGGEPRGLDRMESVYFTREASVVLAATASSEDEQS